jgi:hypothetical protein
MASSVSEMTLLQYEDNPDILSYGTTGTPSAPTSSGSSLYDNINNYLSGTSNWLNNFTSETNPFNIANNLLVQPVVNNPYVIGFDNMFYSLPGINSIWQAANPNSSLGLGGTIIPNTPSTPANSPTELAKTAGTAAGNVVSGAVSATEAGINSAVNQALNSILPKGANPQWNWSLIILGIVALIIIMVIFR